MTLTTKGLSPNVTWEPFIDGNRVGYKVTRLKDGAVTFIYMNPSTEGDGEPDVFVYTGPRNDPMVDHPLHYYIPEF